MLRDTARELNKKMEQFGKDLITSEISGSDIKNMDAETFGKIKNLFEVFDLAIKLNYDLCATIDRMENKIDELVKRK
jgi:hypothetical protein